MLNMHKDNASAWGGFAINLDNNTSNHEIKYYKLYTFQQIYFTRQVTLLAWLFDFNNCLISWQVASICKKAQCMQTISCSNYKHELKRYTRCENALCDLRVVRASWAMCECRMDALVTRWGLCVHALTGNFDNFVATTQRADRFYERYTNAVASPFGVTGV